MTRRYSVFWTTQAITDLEDICVFILNESPAAAREVYGRIRQFCERLKRNPERCRIVPELLDEGLQDFREIIVSPYRIIFKLTARDVYVIAVVDGRRDMESFLLKRLLRS